MYGLETIIEMNKAAGEKARAEGTRPLRLAVGFEWPPPPGVQLPSVGDAEEELDEELVRVDTLFVDTSGWGQADEPALTLSQLGDRLRELAEGHGPLLVATVEHGQFQANLGVWKDA